MRKLSLDETTQVAGGLIGGTTINNVSLDANGLNVSATFAPVGEPVKSVLGLLGIQTQSQPNNLTINLGP